MFLILPKTLLKFFSWPKFDESCWNNHMIPVHSRAVSILPSGAKKNDKIVSDYFAVLAIILPLIWLLFSLSLENRHYFTRECSGILCPNFENFCPNNGQFFSVGDATASPASPCCMLMSGIRMEKYKKIRRDPLWRSAQNPCIVFECRPVTFAPPLKKFVGHCLKLWDII